MTKYEDILIFDSAQFEDDCGDLHFMVEDDVNYIESVLRAFVRRYEARYRTSINSFLFKGHRSSHYGSIGGGGASVGKHVYLDSLTDMLIGDRVEMWVDDCKNFQVRTYDHDGANYMDLILITDSEFDKFEGSWYDDIRVWHDEVSEKQPTILDKEFIDHWK